MLRGLVVASVAGAALLAGAQAAVAHVTVTADNPEPGGYTKAAFRVPNERADASTTRLEVAFPADHPFGKVSVAPVPGWTATVATRKLAAPIHGHGHGGTLTEGVESITWQGGEVKPGEFVEFPVSFGPLPHGVDGLVFKALQTYSDGEVVRWIEVGQAGAPEPEYPAPVLAVHLPAAPAAEDGTDPLARVLGVVGLVTAFGALAACVAVLPAARRRAAGPRPPAPVEAAVAAIGRQKEQV
ncbi:YcnI family protein [Actinokineospora iranica]|nr:YcnI family protein [Actinokineospora iranica]